MSQEEFNYRNGVLSAEEKKWITKSDGTQIKQNVKKPDGKHNKPNPYTTISTEERRKMLLGATDLVATPSVKQAPRSYEVF